MSRKPWDLAFTAEPREVAALRRIMRLHLGIWGLQEVIDEAQLCMSELVSNVITHVGPGTPATLAVSMNGFACALRSTTPMHVPCPPFLTRTPTPRLGEAWRLWTPLPTAGASNYTLTRR